MTGYETLLLVAFIAAAAIIITTLVVARVRKRRHEHEVRRPHERVSRDPRQERAVSDGGRKRFETRALDARELRQFRARWDAIQQRFVDSPVSAVREAQTLVVGLMTARGYPDADVETRLHDLSEHDPQLVEHFRTASAVARAARLSEASTEDLRRATIHYRVLFDELLEGPLLPDIGKQPTEAPV